MIGDFAKELQVELPAESEPEPPGPAAKVTPFIAPKLRVLIVDDSKMMRSLLSSYFCGLGCETVLAEDGVQALHELESKGRFEVATVDWDMPRMDGLQFIQAVRQRPQFNALKLLMLTERSSMEDVSRALEVGANQYLMKPVTCETIQDRLCLMGLLAD
jgi:two-component system chemotaxis response regulator CheY